MSGASSIAGELKIGSCHDHVMLSMFPDAVSVLVEAEQNIGNAHRMRVVYESYSMKENLSKKEMLLRDLTEKM